MDPRHLFRCSSRLMLLALVVLWCATGLAAEAAGETLLRVYPTGPRFDDRWKLLELALAHVASHPGQYRLSPYPEAPSQRRAFALLDDGTLDVVSYGSSPEREAGYLPVRVDLLRGMLGYRQLLVRSQDADRLLRLDDAGMRRQLRFGGATDTQQANLEVLRADGFLVQGAPHRERMVDMLEAGRFDVYTVGLNELFGELANLQQRHAGIARLPGVALYYPFPAYFWVRRDRAALARLIETGLRASLADGSFRRLFEQAHAAEIALLRREPQRVIRLDNPLLPVTAAEPADSSWWWPAAAAEH